MNFDESLIRIGRLNKKIRKLITQRDHWKKMYEYYAKVIELQPFLLRRYEDYNTRIAKENANKQLAVRVKEQELLIRYLSGEKILSHEIDNAYKEMIIKLNKENKK